MINIKEISKRYGQQMALDNVSIEVTKGAILGLIGQNGAGKTTLMGIIANLAKPTQGQVTYSDRLLLNEGKRNIGILIDAPSLYKDLTAKENLEIVRIQRGIPGNETVQKVLERVGLDNTGKKKVKNFSLGMRQRLAIGMAIIGDPEFIILDEPTNGLDPMGIIEIRNLILKLNQELGITIIVSSHQLSELYQVATEYVFIHGGKLMQQVSHTELKEQLEKKIYVQVSPLERAVQILTHDFPWMRFNVSHDAPGWLQINGSSEQMPELSRRWHEQNVIVERMREEQQSLEDYFKSMIV